GDHRTGADRDEYAVVDVGNIDHGNKPALGKAIITNVRVAGAITAHRAEESIRGSVEPTEDACFAKNLDAAVDNNQNLGRSDCPHAVGRDEARFRALSSQEAYPHSLGNVRRGFSARAYRPLRDYRRIGIMAQARRILGLNMAVGRAAIGLCPFVLRFPRHDLVNRLDNSWIALPGAGGNAQNQGQQTAPRESCGATE